MNPSVDITANGRRVTVGNGSFRRRDASSHRLGRRVRLATTAVARENAVATMPGQTVMKVQATVLLKVQAKTLADMGAVLDDVHARARERDDVDVGRVEFVSPPGDRYVTPPPLSAPADRHRPPVSATITDGG